MEDKRAVFSILVRENKVLFVKHANDSKNPTGTYGLPGGKIDTGENSAEAAAREILEETGLAVEPANLDKLGSYSIDIETKRGMEPWNVDLYFCRKFEGETKRQAMAEEPTWLDVDDVLANKYKMPKMSGQYLQTVFDALRRR